MFAFKTIANYIDSWLSEANVFYIVANSATELKDWRKFVGKIYHGDKS